jgi:hypothetical protein
MKSKPHIFKAFITALLAAIIFIISYIVSYLVVGGIIYLLSKIPLIGKLVNLLFYFRGDTPDMLLAILCPGVAYYVTMAAQKAMNKESRTRGLSCVLHGVCIVLLQIVFIVINLIYGDGILKNVIQAIAGFVIFSNGMGELKEN